MKRSLSLILALVMLIGMMPMQAFATEEAEVTPWSGRSAVFVGDSITAGTGTTKTYYQFLEETLGFGSVTAMGVAGSCVSAASDYGQSNQPLINRYQSIPSADLIVVFMGTNDYGHETPLGSVEDTQDGTFYGALNTIIPALVAKHTSSKIVFVTPLHRYGFGTSKILGTQFTYDHIPNGVGATLGDYVDALKTVCANNGVSVIDLHTEYTLDPADADVRTNYMPDGLHPNAAGHEVIAGIMESHIRSYEPVEGEPVVQTELIHGNKFAAGNNQSCRASSRINYYLKAGTVITLNHPDVMQWACAKTSDENSSSNLGYFPDSGWSDKETAVVAADGWVGFTFKYRDETQSFDLTKPLSDYITIEDPHTHTYENGNCTACDAEHPNLANYEGKVISILGDSISTFAGYIPVADGFNLQHDARYPQDNLFTEVEHTWWMQVLTALDAKLGINESWRSTEVYNYIDAEVNSSYDGTKACMASVTRIQNLGSNGTPDVILFFGGTNDITQSRPVGTFNPSAAPLEVDLTSVKWDTVADAYVDAIMRMQYYYPDAQIIAMLPFDRNSQGTAKVNQYNSLFISICEHYGVPYVDLRECGISNADLPDGTHPDATGMDYITRAVLDTLLNDMEMEAGEHIVHSVTHNLNGAESSLGYYKGITHGKSFVTTITGENVTVSVTMGGADITDTAYANGVVTIAAVTGDLVITAQGRVKTIYEDHLQQLPENLCCSTNLWSSLVPENTYYTGSAWGNVSGNSVYSITIPVAAGDQIWATSFQKSGTNGGSRNGIRLTWFDESGVLESVSPDNVYTEFSANGYLPAPEGVVAVNVVMWNGNESNEVYILNRGHIYENGICTGCGATQPGPIITQQPVNGEAKMGERYMVEVLAEGDGLTYQWYGRNAGSKSWFKSSVKDNTYDDVMTETRAGREVYCVITDANGNSVTTDTVKLVLLPSEELAITKQPTDGEAVLGERFCVTVEATGEGLKYQWYFRNKGATNWSKSSVTDNTYDDIMNNTRAGREVYCVITDRFGNKVTTDTVKLVRVPMKLEITSQPTDAEAAFGEMFCATVEAKGEGLKYQWYYRNAGSEEWHKSGVRDNTYDDEMTKARAGREIYCVITDQWGNTITTDTVKLIAVPKVELKLLGVSYESAAMGGRFCVTVEAEGDGLTYQWYFRNAGAARWSKSGVTDNTYDDVMNKTRANRAVYCVITDACGNQITTEVITLTVEK